MSGKNEIIHPSGRRLTTEHRPWPLPEKPWIMSQVWHDLLFAHWPVPIGDLRRLIPDGLELDIFEGQSWVGILPFHLTGVQPRWLPPIPTASEFIELNLRTYVRAEDKPGIYFFSLDASSALAVLAARIGYFLPYYKARMSVKVDGKRVRYNSRRNHPGAAEARFHAAYRPTGPFYQAKPGSLEYWFAERYCLYTQGPLGQIFRADILHHPWLLQPAEGQIPINTMFRAHKIPPPDTSPLLHFARRQDVLFWPLERVKDLQSKPSHW